MAMASFFLEGGKAGRYRRHPHGTGLEDLVGNGEDECTVDAARVANEDGAHLPKDCAQLVELAVSHGGDFFSLAPC